MHLLGNQLLYSLIIDPCLAGEQLIYILREGMLEVADTLPDSGRGEYFRTSEYFGTSLLASFRAAEALALHFWRPSWWTVQVIA